MKTTFNDIPLATSIADTDYLIGYRGNDEKKITASNTASYINSSFTYNSAINTNHLIGPQPDYINMNGNKIINCKNSLKAWVTFNGYMNGFGSGTVTNVPGGDPYIIVGGSNNYTTSTTNPLVGGNPNKDTTVYVYTLSAYSYSIKGYLPQYSQIFVTTSSLSGSYEILSFPTANSFTFQYIATNTNTVFPTKFTWYNQPMMASYNVSSITFVSNGYYRINFLSNTFNDIFYSIIGGSLSPGAEVVQLAGDSAPATVNGVYYPYGWYNKTTSQVDVYWNVPANGDSAMVFFGFFGN
jgi:hypothetical protein